MQDFHSIYLEGLEILDTIRQEKLKFLILICKHTKHGIIKMINGVNCDGGRKLRMVWFYSVLWWILRALYNAEQVSKDKSWRSCKR